MARIPYADSGRESAETAHMYEVIEGTWGRLVNFWKLLGHSPAVLRWMAPLSMTVQRENYLEIDPTLKRLAIIRTSLINECQY